VWIKARASFNDLLSLSLLSNDVYVCSLLLLFWIKKKEEKRKWKEKGRREGVRETITIIIIIIIIRHRGNKK